VSLEVTVNVIASADVTVGVSEPVFVAVHLNVNSTVSVIRPLGRPGSQAVDGDAHPRRAVPVRDHEVDHHHGIDRAHVHTLLRGLSAA